MHVGRLFTFFEGTMQYIPMSLVPYSTPTQDPVSWIAGIEFGASYIYTPITNLFSSLFNPDTSLHDLAIEYCQEAHTYCYHIYSTALTTETGHY